MEKNLCVYCVVKTHTHWMVAPFVHFSWTTLWGWLTGSLANWWTDSNRWSYIAVSTSSWWGIMVQTHTHQHTHTHTIKLYMRGKRSSYVHGSHQHRADPLNQHSRNEVFLCVRRYGRGPLWSHWIPQYLHDQRWWHHSHTWVLGQNTFQIPQQP